MQTDTILRQKLYHCHLYQIRFKVDADYPVLYGRIDSKYRIFIVCLRLQSLSQKEKWRS